jgi:serralysin
MPTPYAGSSTSSVPFTGDPLIDGLIIGEKWGGSLGSAATVSFSFPHLSSTWSTDPQIGYGGIHSGWEPWDDEYRGFNATERYAAQVALEAWGAVANINPVETADNASVVGDIRFAFTTGGTMDADTYAYAYTPLPNTPYAGDVWLNPFPPEPTGNDFAIGAAGYATIIHEVGHALGLDHPFSINSFPEQLDTFQYTVMSYSDAPGHIDTAYSSFYPTTPMLLDIQALQYLYGANMTYRTGNNVYVFNQGDNYYQTIWDAAGIDAIRYNSTSDAALIDLRGGHFSRLGNPIFLSDGTVQHDNVAIAYGAWIERALGGNADDRIIGNSRNNVLDGRAGDDTLTGGNGNDKLIGGDGNDRLNGNGGHDSFTFRAPLDASANVDRITSFNVADDTMQLDIDIFSAFAMAGVALTGPAFYRAPAATSAHDASDRIIYDRSSGDLYYDPDGTGAEAITHFATLAGAPAATAADFFIVA